MSLYRRFQDRFGTAGVILGMIALILALGGTALAAKGALTSQQKKEVKKIAKKYAGKPGPQGPAGPQGSAGKDGSNGANGTNGTNGQSVTGTPIAAGTECGAQTGVKYTLNGTSTKVCNGETGFTETLPSNETETGAWAVGNNDVAYMVSLSFTIPLEEAPELGFVNVAGEEAAGGEAFHEVEHCTGSAEEPSAPAGYVCIYGASEELGEGPPGFGWFAATSVNTFVSGAAFPYVAGEEHAAWGTWAVTAP